MWLYFILVLLAFVLSGVLWGMYTLHSQRLKHEQTDKDWQAFLDEDPKLWKYNGNQSWTFKTIS